MSAAIQGLRPHSNPPLRTTLLAGVGVQVEVTVGVALVDVLVVMVDRIGGLQEQAEL